VKLVITVCQVADVVYVGGDACRFSTVVDLPTDGLPKAIQEAIADAGTERAAYEQVSFSILLEPKPEGAPK